MISYIQPGSSLTHTNLQELWQAADNAVANALQSQSLFLNPGHTAYGTLNSELPIFERCFFFGTTVAPVSQSSLSDVAITYFAPFRGWKRIYSDTAIQNWIDNIATIDTGSIYPSASIWSESYGRTEGVIRLNMPTDEQWDTLKTALWPGDTSNQAGSFYKYNFLELSLRVHQKEINGVHYNVFVEYADTNGGDGAEYQHWYEPIDVVYLDGAGTSLTWPKEYNKYRLIRFNNLQTSSISVQLEKMLNWNSDGYITLEIPPMESRCARISSYGPNRGWIVSGKYFFEPQALDPWFKSKKALGYAYGYTWISTGDNITDGMDVALQLVNSVPKCVLYSGQTSATTQATPTKQTLDYSKFWDTRFLYYGSGVGSDANHIGTPAGGWFGQLLTPDTTKIGDLIYHRGEMAAMKLGGDWNIKRVPYQYATITENPQTVILTRPDGNAARSASNVVVYNSCSISIPSTSFTTLNWDFQTFNNTQRVVFYPRTTGDEPMILPNTAVSISYNYTSEDKRHIFDYRGIDHLKEDLEAVSASVEISEDDSNYFVLGANEQLDVAQMSTNLLSDGIGYPGVDLQNSVVLSPVEGTYFSSMSLQESYTNGHYHLWSYDGESYTLGNQVDIGLTSSAYVQTGYTYYGPWRLDKTLTQVSNDILSASSDIEITPHFKATIFGPGIELTQSVAGTYPIDTFAYEPNTYMGMNSTRQDWKLAVNNRTASFTAHTFLPLKIRRGTGGGYSLVRPSWPHYDGQNSLDYADLECYTPRTRRAILRTRVFNPNSALNVLEKEKTLVPGLYKEYFENEPFSTHNPVALSSIPLQGIGTDQVQRIGFLGKFERFQYPEHYYRFGAWLNKGRVFRCPVGGNFIEDFSTGSSEYFQNYYASARSQVLYGSYESADADTGGAGLSPVPVLPMTVEHFNSMASIVNSLETGSTNNVRTIAQKTLLETLEAKVGYGLGSSCYRPITQWAGWDNNSNPELTTLANQLGFTVLTQDDFPSPWDDILTERQTYDDGNGNLTYGDSGSLATTWDIPTYSGTNYRWITIENAQAIYTQLGCQFVMQEICCPGTLEISNVTKTKITNASNGTILANGAGWYNDEGGNWCYIPDGYSAGRIPLRKDVSPTDYRIQTAQGGAFRTTYGNIDSRHYVGGIGGVYAGQRIVSNECLLVRLFGCKSLNAIIWPQNYIDYQRNYSATNSNLLAELALWTNEIQPAIAVNTLEGTQPEIYSCTANSETYVTTNLENGFCCLWPK